MPATTLKFTQEVAGVGTLTLKFEAAQTIELDGSSVLELARLAVGLHRDLLLQGLRFRPKPGGPATTFLYSFTGVDGREWDQEIEFDIPQDPKMNFDTGVHKWRQSEFAPHRPIRDTIVLLVQTKGLYDLRCDWEPV